MSKANREGFLSRLKAIYERELVRLYWNAEGYGFGATRARPGTRTQRPQGSIRRGSISLSTHIRNVPMPFYAVPGVWNGARSTLAIQSLQVPSLPLTRRQSLGSITSTGQAWKEGQYEGNMSRLPVRPPSLMRRHGYLLAEVGRGCGGFGHHPPYHSNLGGRHKVPMIFLSLVVYSC